MVRVAGPPAPRSGPGRSPCRRPRAVCRWSALIVHSLARQC